jgi:large subunit ribosomal protein L15
LDRFYIALLGPNGDKVLSEEIKWLAVTHKSFDQGRRGFNDRLAFLGKRIVSLQASLALVQDAGKFATKVPEDACRRKPFTHPALSGLHNVSSNTRNYILNKYNIAKIAEKYDLQKVLRWSPKVVSSLKFPLAELCPC